jgi:hypothetical protein
LSIGSAKDPSSTILHAPVVALFPSAPIKASLMHQVEGFGKHREDPITNCARLHLGFALLDSSCAQPRFGLGEIPEAGRTFRSLHVIIPLMAVRESPGLAEVWLQPSHWTGALQGALEGMNPLTQCSSPRPRSNPVASEQAVVGGASYRRTGPVRAWADLTAPQTRHI